MLITHILSATIGIIGAFLCGIPVLRNSPISKISRIAYWLTFVGILFVTASGIGLFIRNPQTFLESGKFLSNMTIMLVLLVIEVSYLFIKVPTAKQRNRVISLFSWSWIYLMALLNPQIPYLYFIVMYLLLIGLTLYIVRQQKTT